MSPTPQTVESDACNLNIEIMTANKCNRRDDALSPRFSQTQGALPRTRMSSMPLSKQVATKVHQTIRRYDRDRWSSL